MFQPSNSCGSLTWLCNPSGWGFLKLFVSVLSSSSSFLRFLRSRKMAVIIVPQMTTSPLMTPPMIGPRLFEEASEGPSSEEVLLTSAEVLCAAPVLLVVVFLGSADDVCVCDVANSVDSDV